MQSQIDELKKKVFFYQEQIKGNMNNRDVIG